MPEAIQTQGFMAAPLPAKKARRINWPSDQFIIAFMLVSVLLSCVQLKNVGVGAYAAFVCFYAYVERRSLLANPNVKLMTVLLGFGLVSAVWSMAPFTTIYYGLQIVLTAFGAMIIVSSTKPYDSLMGVTLSLIGHTVLSHIFGQYVPWENRGYVFIGILAGKNYYGAISGLTVLTSIGLVYASLTRGQKWITAIAVFGVIAGEFGLIRSLAMGYTLSSLLASVIIIYLNVYRKLTNRLRFGLMLYVIYAAVIVAVVGLFLKNDITALILHVTHKDATLTGRTEIWAVARDAIKHRMWLGTGQSAFWVPGNPYAERIWTMNHIITKKDFPLHSTYLEIMVSTGIAGLVVNVGVAGWLLVRQWRALVVSPTTIQITWSAICLYFMLLMGVESLNLTPMDFRCFFIVMGLTFCAVRLRGPAPSLIKEHGLPIPKTSTIFEQRMSRSR